MFDVSCSQNNIFLMNYVKPCERRWDIFLWYLRNNLQIEFALLNAPWWHERILKYLTGFEPRAVRDK